MRFRLIIILILAGGIAVSHQTTTLRLAALVAAGVMSACVLMLSIQRSSARPLTVRRARILPPLSQGWLTMLRFAGGHPWWIATILCAIVTLATAIPWHRGLPHLGVNPWHDAESNLLQARLLLEGHLCRPALEHADAFRTIHVLVTPIYCSKYPIGYPAVLAAGLLLHCSTWIPPLLAGLTVATAWLLGRRTLGRQTALLAAMSLACCSIVIDLGMIQLSSTLTMFLGTLIVGLWLRQIKQGITLSRGLLLGILLSITFLTRPVDAMALGVMIGAAQLFISGLRCGRYWGWIAAVFVGVVPGVAATLAIQHATTGEWLNSPYLIYEKQQSYTGQFIFEQVAPAEGLADMPISIRRFGSEYTEPIHRAHTLRHLPMAIGERFAELSRKMGASMLLLPLIFLPAGRRRRMDNALLAVAVGYFALHLVYAFNCPRYLSPIYAAMAWGMIAGIRGVPANLRGWMQAALVCFVLLGMLREDHRLITSNVGPDEPQRLATLALDPGTLRFHSELKQLPEKKLLVFVRYAPDHRCDREYVYNMPDLEEADCIFAHDLGPEKNRELIEAYPNRAAYLFDENTGGMTPLPR